MEILRIRNTRVINRVLDRLHEEESLNDLGVDEVFARCLSAQRIPESRHAGLLSAYREVLASLHEEDVRAE
jgi:exonuclease SbcD